MPGDIPQVAFWCLAAAALTVLVLLVRQRGITAALLRRNAQLAKSVESRDAEVRHLVDVRLPSVVEAMHHPVPVAGLADAQLAGSEFARSLHSVTERFTRAVEEAQSRADRSARTALNASMRALQGLANEQQLAISAMQDRHDDPAVLEDLLEIDHTNSQFGRRAQVIAVLCGSWPGRQRAASGLVDVVRGATSRIRDYRRIRLQSKVDRDVISRAVEPVVLAVAELLDNAARHSQPDTEVEVCVRPAHNGASIVIDDAGVGMDAGEVEKADMLLTGQRVVDVTRLGDPPQFGFAVIGVLAKRYGFRVSVDTRSPFGGVRAVVFLPNSLLTRTDADGTGAAPRTAAVAAGTGSGTAPGAVSARVNGDAEPVRLDAADAVGERRGAVDPRFAPSPGAQLPPDGEPASFGPANGRRPAVELPLAPQTTVAGLPRRRRRQPRTEPRTAAGEAGADARAESVGVPGPASRAGAGAAAEAGPGPADGTAAADRSPEEIARRLGAFVRGTRSGRAADQDADHTDEGKPQG